MTAREDDAELEFPVVNLATARFECTFGRGCEGACCRNGRPPVYPDEAGRIRAVLDLVADRLRPEVRASVTEQGFLSRRQAAGAPMMRVANGWCVFFNRGCVLHAIGAEEGDRYRYKPSACSLFPLAKDRRDRWVVRQRGLNGELWDLHCLEPASTVVPAHLSLASEIALAQRLSRQEEDARLADRIRYRDQHLDGDREAPASGLSEAPTTQAK